MSARPRVLFAAGGTGGHVYPALATAAALAEQHPDVEIEFVGTAGRFEGHAVPAAGWPLHTIDALPLTRKPSFDLLRLPLVLGREVRALRRHAREHGVAAAAVFGGYVTVPLVLAARSLHLPLVVQEQNSTPGVANRLAARWAEHVAVTFPASAARFPRSERVVVTGNPVRPGFSPVDRESLRVHARRRFELDEDRATLLVFGGSQGARRLNEALVASVGHWRDPAAIQLLHLAGRAGYEEAELAWARCDPGKLVVRCLPFADEMELAYAAADVVVSRAGASTIAELTLLEMPSVLVPYPHATGDHQSANARDLEAAGGAVVVADHELDGARLVAAAEPLLLDAARRAEVGRAAGALARPDAAVHVARLIASAAGLDAIPPVTGAAR